jgi:putative transposase
LDDYLRADSPTVSENTKIAIRSLLADNPGLTLEELCAETESVANRDDLYRLIACEDVYIDLHAVSLSDRQRVRVFLDRETATAHSHLLQTLQPSLPHTPQAIDLAIAHSALQKWKV